MANGSSRATTVEGIFYPSDPVELEAEVRRYLAECAVEPQLPVAVVAPHAAFEFAGTVIASAFRAASGRADSGHGVKSIVVIAPVHRDPPDGFVLPESSSFQCPLGDVEVDRAKVEELLHCGTVFSMNDIPHLEEHSIEVLLPFLRHVFPGARLVPVLTGKAGRRAVLALSRALEMCFAPEIDRTLFVVSTNAATSFPRGKGTAEEADRFLALLLERRWKDLLEESDHGRISSCGCRGLASVLAFGNIQLHARLLARSSSSDDSGARAVHYVAVSL